MRILGIIYLLKGRSEHLINGLSDHRNRNVTTTWHLMSPKHGALIREIETIYPWYLPSHILLQSC